MPKLPLLEGKNGNNITQRERTFLFYEVKMYLLALHIPNIPVNSGWLYHAIFFIKICFAHQ